MVTIRLDGGLGNQMFQYAFIKSLSIHRNDIFEIDISTFVNTKERGVLQLQHAELSLKIKSSSTLSVNLSLLRSMRKLGIGRLRNIFVETGFAYDPSVFTSSCNYFYGYFQSYRYFHHLRNILINEFRFRIGQQSIDVNIDPGIETVGIHVRKGDYLSNNKVLEKMFQLDKDYYLEASKKIADKIGKPVHFFLFSNDHRWVSVNLLSDLNKIGSCTLVDHNNEDNTLFDFECLKNCKHQIISNSTFSWWAAYLNDRTDRCVIAPKSWYKNVVWNSNDLYPPDWMTQ